MELTRRELLRAAAGAAAASALSACGAPEPGADVAAIAGEIVGAPDVRAHVLRPDGELPAGPPSRSERVRVAIVGAGIAGLSAAWKLARSGETDFVVLDLEDAPGGTAMSGRNAVSAHPWGAHYVPVPTREQRTLCELLEEAGAIRGFDAEGRAVPVEDHVCRAPQERLFHRGHWSEGLYLADGAGAADRAELARFHEETARLAAWRDAAGRRAFALPVARSSPDPEMRALDRISMAEWMHAHGFTSRRLLWYVEYGCRDDFGSLLPTTSAWAALHYFCARIAVPGGEPGEFLTWPEGNGFLVRHLARSAEGRIRTGAVVVRVEQDADGARVRWIDTATGEVRETVCERVVCAVPRFVARRIVPDLDGETGGFAYVPWVVANLTLRDRPAQRGYPTCWDNVLYEGESLGYVVATHQQDRLGRDSVWTWYRPFCGDDLPLQRAAVLALKWEDWRDEVLRDLVRAHPDLVRHVVRIDVRRWGHAMVRPSPGFLWGGARERAAAPLGRIHFAGADLGGLPLIEEAQWSGVRAAEEVLAASGARFESSL